MAFSALSDSDTQIYLRSSPRRNFVQKISRFLCCQIDRRRPYRTATKFWRMRLSSRKYRVVARETLPGTSEDCRRSLPARLHRSVTSFEFASVGRLGGADVWSVREGPHSLSANFGWLKGGWKSATEEA